MITLQCTDDTHVDVTPYVHDFCTLERMLELCPEDSRDQDLVVSVPFPSGDIRAAVEFVCDRLEYADDRTELFRRLLRVFDFLEAEVPLTETAHCLARALLERRRARY
jgi:hypothetical protein